MKVMFALLFRHCPQLADALRSNASRVCDLFRAWDADGDGEISRKEFQKAMPALGYDVQKEDVDELFKRWDSDGGGSLAYKELKRILSTKPEKRMSGANSANGIKKGGLAASAVSGMKKVDEH